MDLTAEAIVERLNHQTSDQLQNPYPEGLLEGEPQPAAVLIPMIQQGRNWHLLFIRRTEVDGDPHSGQVAFPGGRCDPEDPNPTVAALRETQEELGIAPEDVRIVGQLQDLITISNYRVTPMVGIIPWPYPLNPSPDEVSRVFSIPLEWLKAQSNREEYQRELPGTNQPVSVIYFNEYDNELLWGLSARITVNFLSVLFQA